jgi:hypothetical protein
MYDWVDENKQNLKALGPILTSKIYFSHFQFVLPEEAEEAMNKVKKEKEKFDASEHLSVKSKSSEESFEEASSESHEEESDESDANEADESNTFSSQ